MPLKDVAKAGGWRDPNTLLTCYQQSDEGTLTRVVLAAGKLCEIGVKELPHFLPQGEETETPTDGPALALVRS